MSEKIINQDRLVRFFLSNASEGVIELTHAPDGWEKAGFGLSRDSRYKAIFRKYAINKLGFVKEGKEYLEKIEADQGFEAEVSIVITEWDSTNLTDVEVFRGDIQLVDKDADDIKYTVPVSDSNFENKLINRQDVDVIVTKRSPDEIYKSLDGKVIQGFANEGNLITLPSRIDYFSTSFNSIRDNTYTYGVGGDKQPIIPVLSLGDSDYKKDNSVVKTNENSFLSINGAFYANIESIDVVIEFNGLIDFTITLNPFMPLDDCTVKIYIINQNDEIQNEININLNKVLTSSTGGDFPALTYRITGDLIQSIIVPSNHYLQIGIINNETPLNASAFISSSSNLIIDFSLRTQSDFAPKINIESMMLHEAFSRIGQVITGSNNPFYSNLLGRKDSEPRSYNYTTEASLLTVTNGGLIRGFSMQNSVGFNEAISPLSISLKDLFDSINTIRPIGLGIETIDGEKVYRIEDLKYFFDTRIAITIDNATNIKVEYNKDLIINEIEIGYLKSETDEIRDGLFDYNTKSKWSNAIISAQKKETFLSQYSASNTSINEARKITKSENPTTDSKYDKINYLIEVVENINGNVIKNGNAENGLSDWSVSNNVTNELLAGSNRFVLPQKNGGQEEISQYITAIPEPILSFSYAVISSDELLFTPTYAIVARLNDNSQKSLNNNGDWVDGSLNFPIKSIQGVKETDFQSMHKFEIVANEPLQNINHILVWFDTEFLDGKTGTNKLILDDIYLSDSAKLKARTTEGFDSITGIVNSNDSYNINLSPARSLRRRGYVLRAPLDDKLNTSYVFSDSEKNSTLVSKKKNESFSVSESSDVLVNDLEEPLWGIEKISFDAAITTQQRRDIIGNFDDGKLKANGIVEWRRNENENYKYGWIEEFDSGGLDGKAKFEIIPISKYITIAKESYMRDDDLGIFTDDDLGRFLID